MGVTALLATGIALAGASTGYQINAANEAADKADAAAEEQKKAQDKLISDQKDAELQAKTDAASLVTRNQQQDALRQNQAQGQGRSSTILTSPLGIPGNALAQGKTILGA